MAELITGFTTELEDAKNQQANQDDGIQVLTFLVGGKTYAVGILEVDEIIESTDITEVPMTPDFIRGVINLRGQGVIIVDLASRLNKGASEVTSKSCIVLFKIHLPNGAQQPIGVMVDEVVEIIELQQENIQPVPNMGEGSKSDFIQSMGRVDSTFMILLEINQILSTEEMGQLQEFEKIQEFAAGQTAVDNE